MTIVTRFFRWLRSLFTHEAPPLGPPSTWLGINAHEDTPADLARLTQLAPNAAVMVRTTNYGDPTSAQRILALLSAGHHVVSIVPFGQGFGPVGANMVLQIDNEPDVQTPAVSPEHYGATFRATMQNMRTTLPATIPIVTAGFSNDASIDWMTRALKAGASDADAICAHVYGDDLVLALQNRLQAIDAAMLAADCSKPLWITEIGFVSTNVTLQAQQLAALLASPLVRAAARVYVYALATDEQADFYGICAHDDARTPRPAFTAVQHALALP